MPAVCHPHQAFLGLGSLDCQEPHIPLKKADHSSEAVDTGVWERWFAIRGWDTREKGGCSRGPGPEVAVAPLGAPLAVHQNPRGAVPKPGLWAHRQASRAGGAWGGALHPCALLFKTPQGVVMCREVREPAAPVTGAGGLLSWELPLMPVALVPPSLGDAW